jgi:UDP-3-O-[3-hydroxymyristoyl] N-acetylglucosamine deacetylase
VQRQTISNAVQITGTGLHSGTHASVCLRPKLKGDAGWVINQTPLHQCTIVSADLATRIRVGHHELSTTEHLFAALFGAGITDVFIDTSASELPILDGSAKGWFQRLAPQPIDSEIEPLRITQKQIITTDSAQLSIEPSTVFSAKVSVSFEGYEREYFDSGVSGFEDAMSARTFGYLDELEGLQNRGLALGASAENVLALDKNNTAQIAQLPKQPNELAQHKWLDLLGDLSLVNRPILGRVESIAGGHRINHIFVNQLRELAW